MLKSCFNCFISSLKVIMVLVFTNTFIAFGEDNYMFSHLDNLDGLSNNRVQCILKDSKGFMWFGTGQGLCRYDGYNFKNYYHNPNDPKSISSGSVLSITEGLDGKLWINAFTKLNIFDPATETFITEPNNVNRNNFPKLIRGVYNDNKGQIFIGCINDGVYVYNQKEDTLYHFNHSRTGLFNDSITSVCADEDGGLWVVNNRSYLEKIDLVNNKVVYRKKIGSTINQELQLFIDSENKLWVYSPGGTLGVIKAQLGSEDLLFNKVKCNSDFIADIEEGNEGNIWIATDHGGLNIYNKNTKEIQYITHNPNNSKGLTQNSLMSLYYDPNGTMWIGTFKKGICYYHKDMFKFQQITVGASGNENTEVNDIDNFVEDENGNLWIGTNGGGLLYYNRKTNAFTKYLYDPNDASSLSSDVIIGMLYSSDNKLWLGTYFGGLNYFDGKRFHRFLHNENDNSSISDNRIWDIYEDHNGLLWLGTLKGGVDCFNPKTKKVIKNLHKLSDVSTIKDNAVFKTIQDQNNKFWFATAAGLCFYDPELEIYQNYSPEEEKKYQLTNRVVWDVLLCSQGYVWAGTQFGLNIINPKTGDILKYTYDDGLKANSILSIQEDMNGDIWLGTDKGLIQVEVTNDLNFKNTGLKFVHYSVYDGLQGMEFNHKSSAKTKNGELLFGGSNGFNIIKNTPLQSFQYKGRPVVTRLEIFNQEIIPGNKISGKTILNQPIYEADEILIPYGQNMFSLEFSALNYFHPNKLRYNYILEGFNNEWMIVDANNRKITYTNLDPGKYTFKLMASDNRGEWNDNVTELNIVVKPAWWQAILFKIFIVLIITALVLAIFYWRFRLNDKRKLELEQLVKERTSKLEEERKKLKDINEVMEQNQQFIIKQSLELQKQKGLLEENNTKLNEINIQLEQRKKLIEQQSEELIAQKEELQVANSNLMEMNSMKNKFFSIIAHDLKNPLNSIMGFSELIFTRSARLEANKMADYNMRIYNSSKNLNKLLENLLQWSRSQTDNILFEPTILNLKNIIAQAVTLHTESMVHKHIEVEYEETDYINVYADNNMVYTVIRNLISNAVKFTPEHGKIIFSCQDKGQFVGLSVQDNGIGMEKEEVGKLFRIDTNYSKKGTNGEAGTGLGLILCKEFVNKNGGEIWVESELGTGSTFSFILPKSEAVMQLNANNEKVRLLDINIKNILIVEDEPTNFYLLKKYLKDSKHQILWSKNGLDALNLIQENEKYNIGIIFMDIRMPIMDGCEASIKIHEIQPDIPIIGQSAYVYEVKEDAVAKSVFTGFINKPIYKNEFLKYLKRYLK